jgi:glycosyltransferase involved in cell wall biosynthesis
LGELAVEKREYSSQSLIFFPAMTLPVSVCIFTYNHEKYIRKCIESVLMQKTNFRFEIVLGEDYSTDRTKEICLDYATIFPEKIRVLDRGKNIGMCENIFGSMKMCKGDYIAILDGDDYWIDPLKLQKQYDFLEKEKEKNLVFHQSLKLNEVTNDLELFVKEIKESYKFEEILDKWLMATGSMFFRSTAMIYPDFLVHSHNFDLTIQMLVNREGNDIGYINEIMSVYRINQGSNTNNPDYDYMNTWKRLRILYTDFNVFTKGKYNEQINKRIGYYDKLINEYNKFNLKRSLVTGLKKLFNLMGFTVAKNINK